MDLMILTFFAAILAIGFVAILFKKLMNYPEGSPDIRSISEKIRKGANTFMRRQYTVVSFFFGILFIVLCVMSAFGFLTWFVPFAFITGGFFSGFAGFVGMKAATFANCRTTTAAAESLNKGLRVAFSAGSIMGFTVVGLGLLDISIWYFLLKYVFLLEISDITAALLTFGMGASSMALFARVGGGIFTKAADVGADLVGKLEAGIPEDDPRNPAVIADNVGDNVGDVAGMGADLYESYVGSIISSSALGVAAFSGIVEVTGDRAVALPMIMAAVGVVASILGTFFVRAKDDATQKALLSALRRGTNFSSIAIAVAAFPLVWFLLGKEYIGIYGAVLSGLFAGVVIAFFTEYYTSENYKPTRTLADSSLTGAATLVIGGLSLGMLSTAVMILCVCVSILVSFFISGGGGNAALGLYGIGISSVSMLSTLGLTLANDAYGPVADNAGGIAQMAHLDPEVRRRTDALDSLGNTTAAIGKGFAIASGTLTALALIASYIERVKELDPTFTVNLSLDRPTVLVGLLIGAMLPFLFTALTMQSVGRAAQQIVIEVRRQFSEITGLMDGTADADYSRCVDLCTRISLREVITPALLSILTPVITGMVLGPNGVVGMLMGATSSGFMMAVMTANSGGAWDNAKKYIESGHHGGKGSPSHRSAVVGDTVGDPLKDTCGPAIDILVKLSSMVSIVFAGLVLAFHVFE